MHNGTCYRKAHGVRARIAWIEGSGYMPNIAKVVRQMAADGFTNLAIDDYLHEVMLRIIELHEESDIPESDLISNGANR